MYKNAAFTTFDIVKVLAILSMTLDHIGMYFFPDMLWFRAVGRIAFPVFLFMAGYSRTLQLKNLCILGSLLVVNHLVVGRPVFALNILFSILFTQSLLHFCASKALLPGRWIEFTLLSIVLTLFTLFIFDYGSIAFLFGLQGWLVRDNQRKIAGYTGIIAYSLYTGWMIPLFGFDLWQSLYVLLTLAYCVKWLVEFQNRVIWKHWTHSFWKTGCVLLSRTTLYYYFIHRIVFELITNAIHPGSKWFTVLWF